MSRPCKMSQFIVNYTPNDGYALICTVEYIAKFLRCSTDQIVGSALVDERARNYLIGVMRRLQAQQEEK